MSPDPVTTLSGAGVTTASGTGTARIAVPTWLLCLGDSKTAGDSWVPLLSHTAQAYAAGGGDALDRGVSGATVATTITNLAVVLAAPLRTTTPTVLINLGVNDIGVGPSQGTWTADYLTLIDAVRAIWPSAPIYLARVWMRGQAAACTTFATWVAAIVSQRANLFLGMDERIWLEGGDDGVTMTLDGIHYSPAGELAAVTAWTTVLWP